MKLDLHVHIKRNSSCAKREPLQVVKEAITNDIDGLVLLDHKYHATELDIFIMSPIKLFRGAEVHIKNKKRKVEDHVIVITEKKIPFPLQINSKDVNYLETFKSEDTLLFLAHPFRKSDILSFDLEKFCPDAIEILSPNTPIDKMLSIESLSFQYHMPLLACSDSHKAGRIGQWYIDTGNVSVNTYKQLAQIVKSGAYELHGNYTYK